MDNLNRRLRRLSDDDPPRRCQACGERIVLEVVELDGSVTYVGGRARPCPECGSPDRLIYREPDPLVGVMHLTDEED